MCACVRVCGMFASEHIAIKKIIHCFFFDRRSTQIIHTHTQKERERERQTDSRNVSNFGFAYSSRALNAECSMMWVIQLSVYNQNTFAFRNYWVFVETNSWIHENNIYVWVVRCRAVEVFSSLFRCELWIIGESTREFLDYLLSVNFSQTEIIYFSGLNCMHWKVRKRSTPQIMHIWNNKESTCPFRKLLMSSFTFVYFFPKNIFSKLRSFYILKYYDPWLFSRTHLNISKHG